MPNGPGVLPEEKIDELIDGRSLHIGLAFVGLNAALPQGKIVGQDCDSRLD
jgi:hypothetical protein